jgi:membrane peptidoglycan carboxypeptidase
VPGHQIAGKTGTTQNNLSVAFVGYTPEITASVMVFNPKDEQNVGGFGGGKGARIWHDAMAPILQARGSSEFPPSDPAVVRGNTRPVPGCNSVDECSRVLAAAGFESATSRINSDRRAGAFVGTSPPRGGRAVQGQLVTILLSNGSDYVAPSPTTPSPSPSSTPAPDPAPTEDPPAEPTESPGVPTLPGSPGPGDPPVLPRVARPGGG